MVFVKDAKRKQGWEQRGSTAPGESQSLSPALTVSILPDFDVDPSEPHVLNELYSLSQLAFRHLVCITFRILLFF